MSQSEPNNTLSIITPELFESRMRWQSLETISSDDLYESIIQSEQDSETGSSEISMILNNNVDNPILLTIGIENQKIESKLSISNAVQMAIEFYNTNPDILTNIIPLIKNINNIKILNNQLLSYLVLCYEKGNIVSIITILAQNGLDFNIEIKGYPFVRYIIDPDNYIYLHDRLELFKIAIMYGADIHKKIINQESLMDSPSAYEIIIENKMVEFIELYYQYKQDNPAKRRRMHNLVLAYDNKCAICHDEMVVKNTMITNCLHAYHSKCIQGIIRCPICKDSI